MLTRLWRLAIAALAIASPALPQPPSISDFRIRVSVNLVQLDATVTDSHGKPVSDLTAADFQILLDGKPQKLVSCNWVKAGVRTPGATHHTDSR